MQTVWLEKKKEKWKNGNEALLFICSFEYSTLINFFLSNFTIQLHLMVHNVKLINFKKQSTSRICHIVFTRN